MSMFPGLEKCRCGKPAFNVCHLCKAGLCSFHTGTKPVSTPQQGFTRIHLEPACFPDCTSSFGALEPDSRMPAARA
jgi:hypothetical protein